MELTDPLPIPKFSGTTIDDLKLYPIELQGVILQGNEDRDKIRQFFIDTESKLNKDK